MRRSVGIIIIAGAILSTFYLSRGARADLDNELLGYWNLNEGQGSVINDTSGNGYHGSVTNAQWAVGLDGGALKFDGAYDAAQVNINIPATLTLSVLARSTEEAVSMTTDWLWFINTDAGNSKQGVYLNFNQGVIKINDRTLCNTPAEMNAWHLYTTVLDQAAGKTQLYIDGGFCGEAAYYDPTGVTLQISSNVWSAVAWNGRVDDVRLYNRAFSQAEVAELYALVPEITTHALTITAPINGSISKTPDKEIYEHGDEVVLQASPDSGAFFITWTGDAATGQNPITVAMDDDKTIGAVFNKPEDFKWRWSEALGRQTYSPDAGSALTTGSHPRLRLTADKLPALREKIRTSYMTEYQNLVNRIDAQDGRWDPSKLDSPNQSWMDPEFDGSVTTSCALIYLLGPIEGATYGHATIDPGTGGVSLEPYKERAVELLHKFVSKEMAEYQASPSTYTHPGNTIYIYSDYVVEAATAYDWLYNEMTQEQREAVVQWLAAAEDRDVIMRSNHRTFDPDTFSSKYFEAHMPWHVGLAFYGDGINDAKAQELVDYFYPLMIDGGKLDMQNWLAKNAGGNSELGYYGLGHPVRHHIQLYDWWMATDENYFAKNTGLTNADFTKLPEYLLYRLTPVAGEAPKNAGESGQVWRYIKMGEQNASDTATPSRFNFSLLGEALKAVDNQLAQLTRWILDSKGLDHARYEHELRELLLMGDRSVAGAAPSSLELPKSRYFANLGLAITRTGFEDTADTALTVLAPPYALGGHSYINHSWLNGKPGQTRIPHGFTINKHGPLALMLQGTFRNTVRRYNIMRFTDPALPPDGGFRSSFFTPTEEEYDPRSYYPGNRFDVGGMKRLQFEDGADYFAMDYTDHFKTDRVSSYEREMVWLKPDSTNNSDYVIVFDRTETARPEIVKRWEISSAYEPETNGVDQLTITNIPPGGDNPLTPDVAENYPPGIDPFSGLAHPEAHGRLFVKTLLPANTRIDKYGGPGHYFDFDDPTQVNTSAAADENMLQKAGALYTGTYHTDVVSTANATTETFLHVMQTADANLVSSMVSSQLVESSDRKMQGALIEASPGQPQAVVMFTRGDDAINQVNYSTNATGNSRHLVANLEAGEYEVVITKEGNTVENHTVTVTDLRTDHYKAKPDTAAGQLYFSTNQTGSLGIQITKVGAPIQSPSPSPAANQPPQIETTQDTYTLTYGDTLSIPITATDPDSLTVTITAPNLNTELPGAGIE